MFKTATAFLVTCAFALAQDSSPRTYAFDKDEPGKTPSGWIAGVTGSKKGSAPRWEVKKEDEGNVLAQLESGGAGGDFPVCLAKDSSFQNGTVSIRFKPVSGKMDQAGGLVFRAKDKDNFYILRANANENNVWIYYTKEGKRISIKSWKTEVKSGEWHTLKVEVKDFTFKVSFDDKPVGEVEDKKQTFPEAGMVGIWTKADSVTYFKSLTFTRSEGKKSDEKGGDKPVDNMTPYRTLAAEALKAFKSGDMETALKKAKKLEKSWDTKGQQELADDSDLWKEIDTAMDAFIDPIKQGSTDAAEVEAAYKEYITLLKKAVKT